MPDEPRGRSAVSRVISLALVPAAAIVPGLDRRRGDHDRIEPARLGRIRSPAAADRLRRRWSPDRSARSTPSSTRWSRRTPLDPRRAVGRDRLQGAASSTSAPRGSSSIGGLAAAAVGVAAAEPCRLRAAIPVAVGGGRPWRASHTASSPASSRRTPAPTRSSPRSCSTTSPSRSSRGPPRVRCAARDVGFARTDDDHQRRPCP